MLHNDVEFSKNLCEKVRKGEDTRKKECCQTHFNWGDGNGSILIK